MEKETAIAAAASPMGNSTSISVEEIEAITTFTFRVAETFLRLLPIGLSVAALLIMLNNSQQNDYGSVSYSHLGSFRYLVNANGICAGYSLLSAAIVARSRPSSLPRAWTFFILDQVQTYMILVAVAMSTEVLYLAENGDASVTWSSACGSFGRFCHKVTASVAITFVAVGCYVLLSLISSYKLFSKYDAPLRTPITTTGIHIATFHA